MYRVLQFFLTFHSLKFNFGPQGTTRVIRCRHIFTEFPGMKNKTKTRSNDEDDDYPKLAKMFDDGRGRERRRRESKLSIKNDAFAYIQY